MKRKNLSGTNMSKMKFFSSVLLIVLFILSCDENNPIDPYGQTSQIYSIHGKLNDWNLGNGKNVIFLGAGDIWNSDKIYSISQIDSYGNFNLNNLDTPSEAMFLNPIYPQFSNEVEFIRNSLICSDSSAKRVWGNFVITISGDTSYSNVGRIYRRNFNDWFYFSEDSVKSGDFIVEYVYADKEVRLSGIVEYDYVDYTYSKKWHVTYEYNMNYKKGWNKEITLVKSQEVSIENGFLKIVTTRSITNFEPLGGRWDYTYYGD